MSHCAPTPWPIDLAAWVRRARLGKSKSPQVALAAMATVLVEHGFAARLVRRQAAYSSKTVPSNSKTIWAVALDQTDHIHTLDNAPSWEQVEDNFRKERSTSPLDFSFGPVRVSNHHEIPPFLADLDPKAALLNRTRKAYVDLVAESLAAGTPQSNTPSASRPRL